MCIVCLNFQMGLKRGNYYKLTGIYIYALSEIFEYLLYQHVTNKLINAMKSFKKKHAHFVEFTFT